MEAGVTYNKQRPHRAGYFRELLATSPDIIGPITALTWASEIGEVWRFSSIKKAVSYCRLCGAKKSSSSTVQRTPLSKQRTSVCKRR
jgi:transposase